MNDEREPIKPILSERAMARLLEGTLWFSLALFGWIALGAFGIVR